MPLPFVSRAKYVQQRRLVTEARARVADLERQLAESKGAREELHTALRRSETERTDLQTTLLRVGFGYAPFQDRNDPTQQISMEPEPDPVKPFVPSPATSAQDVQRLFTEEAMRIHGGDMRKIKAHVQAKLDQYYEHRDRPPVLSDEERDRAARVAADIEAAVSEGRAAARVQ